MPTTATKKKTTTKAITQTQEPTRKEILARLFSAAISRSTLDFTESASINADIQAGLDRIRARARSLSINNEYAKSFLKLVKINLIGAKGILLTAQSKKPNGELDKETNALLEKEWYKWAAYGNCTTDQQMDLVKAEELIVETVARDGECLIALRRGPEFGPHKFQIQILEADHLDHNHNTQERSGNMVYQGVEVNEYGRPVAYHLFKHNPNDQIHAGSYKVQSRNRVPAEDIIHLFDPERPGQRRGFSWLAAVMIALHHVSKYREAELEYARIAAAKQAFYKMSAPDGFVGEDEIDAMQNVSREMVPGAIDILPPGVDITSVDWQSPNAKLAEFQKAVLRGVAAALGVSYHALASDLESVNYSSARFGARSDHHFYQSKQNWFINNFLGRIYKEWLKVQLSGNTLPLPITKIDKFLEVKWTPRGWESIDPVKDSRANIDSINAGLKTRTEVCQENGRDIEEVFDELAAEKEMAEKRGLVFTTNTAEIAPEEKETINKV